MDVFEVSQATQSHLAEVNASCRHFPLVEISTEWWWWPVQNLPSASINSPLLTPLSMCRSHCAKVLVEFVKEEQLAVKLFHMSPFEASTSGFWPQVVSKKCEVEGLFFFKIILAITSHLNYTPDQTHRLSNANVRLPRRVCCALTVYQRGHIRLHRPQQSQRYEAEPTRWRLYLRLHNCCHPSDHANPLRVLVRRWLW